MGQVNSRVNSFFDFENSIQFMFLSYQLQKEIALLREQVGQLQVKAMPPSPSSSNNGYH